VRTINPAGAFNDRRGEHARFAKQFQHDGCADDVHDGIHRADFVEMHFAGWQAVNFSFRFGDALEDGDGFLFDPSGKLAAQNQFFYFGKISLLIVPMIVVVVFVGVNVGMFVGVVMMALRMIVVICMAMFVLVVMREVDIKLHAGDGGFLPVRNVQMIAVELELLQLTFEFGGVHAEIKQRGDKHVAGDAAEEVEIKNFHGEFISATDGHKLTLMVKIAAGHRICVHLCSSVAKALIWLAA